MRIVTAVASLVLLVSCAPGSVHVIPSEELPADLYAPQGTPSPAAVHATTRIWLVGPDGRLTAVERATADVGTPLERALRALLDGPAPSDAAAGVTTAIPADAELIGAARDGSVAVVNLSREFEIGAEQRVLTLRLAQVVWTATDAPDVRAVRFAIDGEPIDVVADDGRTRAGVVGREDYTAVGPAA